MTDQPLTPQQLVDRLNLVAPGRNTLKTDSSVRKFIKRGRIQAVLVSRGPLRTNTVYHIPLSEVDRIIKLFTTQGE